MASTSTMDFFEHQERARRKTGLLVTYYVISVALIILGVYLAVAGTFLGVHAKRGGDVPFARLWNPELFLWVTMGTMLIVGIGTFSKIMQLRAGGAAIARMLGGRPVSPDTKDADERKFLNVVEEMAIASGTPVPEVYLLPNENAINAFAAGFTPGDAVIAVTAGCMRELNRDELQGVVAHEFSHILNGDMRLNLRLVGVLNGILIIAVTGYWIMRSTMGVSRSRSSKGKGNSGSIAILGLLLMIIGYVGVFFGKLIKSAVSRQREYLADASAVQFTRNPDGIAGALKRIGVSIHGSKLESPRAEEASHFFFCDGLKASFLNMMATHPPLGDRIRRIDPSFDGNFRKVVSRSGQPFPGVSGLTGVTGKVAVDSEEVTASVGAPQLEHLVYAQQLLGRLPDRLSEAVRDPLGARAAVYCLLLSDEESTRASQLRRLESAGDPGVYEEVRKLMPVFKDLGREFEIPLIDLAMPALKDLDLSQYERFRENVQNLAAADEEIDLFEYSLQRILMRNLDPVFKKSKRPVVQYYNIKRLLPTCGKLLSCLAHWGTKDDSEAVAAFRKGVARLGEEAVLQLSPRSSCGLKTVDDALNELAAVSPLIKRQIINACAACVAADGTVTVEEAELLRAVADSLDCPMPPLMAAPAA